MKRGTCDAMFKALTDAGFSQREVARLAQVNQSTVCRGIRREFGGQLILPFPELHDPTKQERYAAAVHEQFLLTINDTVTHGIGAMKGSRHIPADQIRAASRA